MYVVTGAKQALVGNGRKLLDKAITKNRRNGVSMEDLQRAFGRLDCILLPGHENSPDVFSHTGNGSMFVSQM